MNERTRKIIVFSTLPIVLAWGYYNLVPNKQTPASPSTDERALATVPPLTMAPQPKIDTATAVIAQIASKPWGIDPFRSRTVHRDQPPPPPTVVKGGLSWVLSGIIFNESSPIAYINGRPVKIGEMVDNAKVVSIERRTVTLDLDGRRLTISLSKEARS